MIFTETRLAGAYVIDPERIADERGFFARTWCRDEFARHGLIPAWSSATSRTTPVAGPCRGMHYQASPHEEAKLVRCTRGAIHDVIVDLRPDSPTYRDGRRSNLSAESRRMLYIPEGFAHGFQTLVDGSEVFYQMSEFFHTKSAMGVRHDDPCAGDRLALAAGERLREGQDLPPPRPLVGDDPLMKRVLVTGATGFVGRHSPLALAARGFEVHATCLTGTPDTSATWHRVDLLDHAQVDRLLNEVRPTHLLHFAWYAVHGKYWTSTENLRWVESSLALLRSFVDRGGRRAVIAGTCTEYDWR